MAVSDSTSSAAAALRRLAAQGDDTCLVVFGVLIDTPPDSGSEGGSSPRGAGVTGKSSSYRLDPVDSLNNASHTTVNTEVISVSGPMIGAAPSPTATMMTMERLKAVHLAQGAAWQPPLSTQTA